MLFPQWQVNSVCVMYQLFCSSWLEASRCDVSVNKINGVASHKWFCIRVKHNIFLFTSSTHAVLVIVIGCTSFNQKLKNRNGIWVEIVLSPCFIFKHTLKSWTYIHITQTYWMWERKCLQHVRNLNRLHPAICIVQSIVQLSPCVNHAEKFQRIHRERVDVLTFLSCDADSIGCKQNTFLCHVMVPAHSTGTAFT